ncbi:hypothetical protein [Elizabethkingia ursingii]|uniref:Phage shock protein PspC N-terminal domain-containing protein n=1 Tax=Elizabethkingia ursingii TaxID=1756150 RepID=A0ABX3NEJ0_9FLAO|nr:hypothetical protein [Elizabethkingia ursingii]OPB94520.1 hypothetical protein BB021_18125 [Elizabethkingia ursingii]
MNKKYKELKGKTRKEVFSVLGSGYIQESTDQILVYILKKYWFFNYGKIIYVFFIGEIVGYVYVYIDNISLNINN